MLVGKSSGHKGSSCFLSSAAYDFFILCIFFTICLKFLVKNETSSFECFTCVEVMLFCFEHEFANIVIFSTASCSLCKSLQLLNLLPPSPPSKAEECQAQKKLSRARATYAPNLSSSKSVIRMMPVQDAFRKGMELVLLLNFGLSSSNSWSSVDAFGVPGDKCDFAFSHKLKKIICPIYIHG